MTKRPARPWSFKTGDRDYHVVVYEREPGGPLYARTWDKGLAGGKGNWRRVSLKHRDQNRAEEYAREQVAKLSKGTADILAGKVTLAHVLALYEGYRTPRKSEGEQSEDRRRIELWTRMLGAGKDPHLVSLGE